MNEIRNYSLADHTLVISNNTYNIVIGNGSSTESITVSFANDNFSYTMAADGTGTLNKNKMRNGSATVSLQQTNPIVNSLHNLYENQMESTPVDTAKMTLKDSNGNIDATFDGCVISKEPDYGASNEQASRDFVILFVKGNLI